MRLIDADELQKEFTEECCGCCDCCSHSMTGYKCELINNAPTLEVFAYTKNGVPLTRAKPSNTLIDKLGPAFEQIAETATNFFEDETISGLLEEGADET